MSSPTTPISPVFLVILPKLTPPTAQRQSLLLRIPRMPLQMTMMRLTCSAATRKRRTQKLLPSVSDD
jgi:hypothetical protein